MNYTLREWQLLEKPINELIVQASTIEEEMPDGWQNFPIGMSYGYISCHTLGKDIQIGQHENIILMAINPETDKARRGNSNINRNKIINTLGEMGIQNHSLDAISYFKLLPHFKFIISPEGNGIDCHRHYEALIAGCIPIIERNKLTKEKYKDLPVLWTEDYTEITQEYLNIKYQEMIDKKYDFKRLFLSYYNEKDQLEIKRCGNYWCQKIRNIIWYEN